MTKSNTLDITTTNDRSAESADTIHDQQQDSRMDSSRTGSATSGHDTADAGTARKRRKSIYNESAKQSKMKYQRENRERIAYDVRTGEREIIQAAAADAGMSVSAYITTAINAYAGKQLITPPGTIDTYHTGRR